MFKIFFHKTVYLTFLVSNTIFFSMQICFATNPAGIINSHDMDLLKQNQQLNKMDKDFQENKEKNEKENEKLLTPPVPEKNKQPADKAKINEYETKGVYIGNVTFSQSKILSKSELDNFAKSLTGKNLFMNDIKKVVNEINDLYARKGYVTARALLPEQTIDNEVLNITLIEGKIGKINIIGNKWTKDSYIRRRINEKENNLFKIPTLENDILNFNRYTDGVKLKANLEAGQKDETTDITIQTEESLPFHFTQLWDNAGRDTIGQLRTGFVLTDDSLLGHRDRLTLGTYLTRASTTPFADYNFPINKHNGRIGVGYSSSFSEIASGDFQMFDIKCRSYDYSLYYDQPLIRRTAFELSSISSMNYKRATTNWGADIYTDEVTSFQTGLGARYDTKKGIWYASQNVYQAFPIFDKRSQYFKYEGNFIRLHDFGHSIVGQFRSNFQWIPQDDIPYVDQFQGGGIASVRGYSEGLLIGKTGYLFSTEILFPILPYNMKLFNKKIKSTDKLIKGVFFADHGAVFPYKGTGEGASGYHSDDYLTSTGLGLRVTLPADITARLYWGFPLSKNSYEGSYHVARFHFELTTAPDFDKLLKLRKRRETL